MNEILQNHSGAIGGAVSAITTALAFLIREWLKDRKEQRDQNHIDNVQAELIGVIKQDLSDRRETEKGSLLVHERNSISLSKLVDGVNFIAKRVDQTNNALADIKTSLKNGEYRNLQ